MVSKDIINFVINKSIENSLLVKCSIKDILRRFQKNIENFSVEDISLDPIPITQSLAIEDTDEIMDLKGIVRDNKESEVLYGAMEMHQDNLQKNVDYSFEEIGGVNNFSCQSYKLINGKLYKTDYYQEHKGMDEWIDNWISSIDSAISKSPPLDVDTTLYRYGFFPSGMKVGETGKFKGFTSTTYQEETAERFKDGYDHDATDRYKITIRTPKGTKGVLLNDTFETMKEHEFLLGRNQKYVVLSVNDETREVEIGLY